MKKINKYVVAPVMATSMLLTPLSAFAASPTSVTTSTVSSYETQLNEYAKTISVQLKTIEKLSENAFDAETPESYRAAVVNLMNAVARYDNNNAVSGKNSELVTIHAKYREVLLQTALLGRTTLNWLDDKITDTQFLQALETSEATLTTLDDEFTTLGDNYLEKYNITPNKDVSYVFYGDESVTYTVKKGDTLYKIAKAHNVTVDEIKEWNDLTSNTVTVGQVLTIFTGETTVPEIPTTPPVPTTGTYTVKKGDTLYKVAKAHNVTVDQLKAWNGLKSTNISVGQVLKVTSPTPTTPDTGYVTYTVVKGDTLYKISKKYNTSVATLKQWNNLKSDSLKVGQVLKVQKK